MPIQEPQPYWPFDEFPIEPAVEIKPGDPDVVPEVREFNQELKSGPVFFRPEETSDADPKVLSPKMTQEEVAMAVTRSLGE